MRSQAIAVVVIDLFQDLMIFTTSGFSLTSVDTARNSGIRASFQQIVSNIVVAIDRSNGSVDLVSDSATGCPKEAIFSDWISFV